MVASFVRLLTWLIFLAASPPVESFSNVGISQCKIRSFQGYPKEQSLSVSSRQESDLLDVDGPTTNRREALIRFQASLLAAMAVGRPQPSNAEAGKPSTILMTGANSGIGLEACKRLSTRSGTTILLACRTLEKAKTAIEAIRSSSPSATAQLVPLACDLADLSSIQACAQQVASNTGSIDTLCLNAGLARNAGATECVRTRDGWEQTVGVNHAGHFLLTHLMVPRMTKSNGRIVVTASGVHDPESPGGAQGIPATLGDLQGLENLGKGCEMLDGGAFNGDKAYKDSKVSLMLKK